MPDRMLEIVAPQDWRSSIEEVLADPRVLESWYDEGPDFRVQAKALLPAELAEAVVDELDRKLAGADRYRIVVLPVEAIVPRREEEEPPDAGGDSARHDAKDGKATSRISRDELYADLEPSARFSGAYLTLVIFSTLVAAVGLHRDSTTLVIGAMLIAPLLGPNIALSLATALGDLRLGQRALKVNLSGVAVAFGLALLIGIALGADPSRPNIKERTEIEIGDIALALAAGVSGVLAFTSAAPASLIGVMVAVALLPPLAAVGMLVGSGHWLEALGAFLLLVTNIICVNLAGVATFLIQGVRPRTWWETEKARRATRIAVGLWVTLLVVLVVAILLSKQMRLN